MASSGGCLKRAAYREPLTAEDDAGLFVRSDKLGVRGALKVAELVAFNQFLVRERAFGQIDAALLGFT